MHRRTSRFFFNDTAATEIYPLSLHDALPILPGERLPLDRHLFGQRIERLEPLVCVPTEVGERAKPFLDVLHRFHSRRTPCLGLAPSFLDPDVLPDRQSTRLNSSH